MTTSILLVEDSDHKRSRVGEVLREVFSDFTLTEAQSFSSGSRMIQSIEFDLIIMDMSLPTYDRSSSESGGRFRTLGGHELSRKVTRKGYASRILFFTQYDSFSGTNFHTLESLEKVLRDDCGDNFLALVHYDSSSSAWREKFKAALK